MIIKIITFTFIFGIAVGSCDIASLSRRSSAACSAFVCTQVFTALANDIAGAVIIIRIIVFIFKFGIVVGSCDIAFLCRRFSAACSAFFSCAYTGIHRIGK